MNRPSDRSGCGLLAAVIVFSGCAENKNKMTSDIAKAGPPKASVAAESERAAPAPLAPSARYSGQILHERQALGAGPAARVIRDQAGYDALVASLPPKRIQMKQPSPPNDDPLLNKPPIDFERQMLVVAIRRNMFLGPKITRVLLARGKALTVEIVHESPDGVMPMGSRSDVGTYEAVVVPRADEPPVFRVEKRTITQ